MSDYYFKQTYSAYASYGIGEPTMGNAGCVITSLAMILSYFNDSPYHPDQMLKWGRENGMLDKGGKTRFHVFPKATDYKLRMMTSPNAKPGEITYAIREVRLKSGLLHWIIDHPTIPGKIIDSWDGKVKDYALQNCTGRAYYYIGKK